jgi:hypothetical protein
MAATTEQQYFNHSVFLYIKYGFMAVFSLVAKYFIAYPLTPFLVLFATGDDYPTLPKWLDWFMTGDNSLDGDLPWRTEWRPFILEHDRLQRYINRCCWLWRNSLHNFQNDVMGVKLQGKLCENILTIGDETIQNTQPGKSGLVKRYLRRDGEIAAFQWYYVRQWPWFPDRCIRINLGWKLWDYSGKAGVSQFTFSPWIWNNYTA